MIHFTVYEKDKDAQWVTFVHGAGGSSSIWFKQIRDFQKHFNVLLLDLRGHGNSNHQIKKAFKQKYTFSALANDILEVLDHLKIQKSHFVGISLGTILIRQLAEMHPDRVQSMILGGAILKMNFRSQILMRLGNMFKYVLPYLVLYKFFAFVIMPNKNHKQSRLLFINEAKKLYQTRSERNMRICERIKILADRCQDSKEKQLFEQLYLDFSGNSLVNRMRRCKTVMKYRDDMLAYKGKSSLGNFLYCFKLLFSIY